MTWLSGYTYRKKGSVVATTAGAQTNYQLELKVGESSGASGANVHCNNHSEDFPNDIRFTKEDGETKHDYWVESITGTTPNRLATVIIELASVPASGSVDFYMYYGKSGDSGESDGDNTFEFFDDFDSVLAWERQGDAIATENTGEPTVIYEGSPQILTGESSVFKLWYMYGWGTPRIYYAESANGINFTTYSGNPLINSNLARPHVVKHNGTYYLYTAPSGDTGIKRYHSSNGVTGWTDDGYALSLGASGKWDDANIANCFVWIEDSTWRMMYDGMGTGTGGTYNVGYATSADGLTWTRQNSGNAVVTTYGGGAGYVRKVGAYYYLWTWGGATGCMLPTDIYRHRSTDLISWTPYPAAITFSRGTVDEGAGQAEGQNADECLLEHDGKVYMYYHASEDGSLPQGHIKLAIADMTFAELVATNENAGNGVDENKWNAIQETGISLSASIVSLYKSDTPHTAIISKTFQITNGIIEARMRSITSPYYGGFMWFRRATNTNGNYPRTSGQGLYTVAWTGEYHTIMIDGAIEANTNVTVDANWHYYRLMANGLALTAKRYADGGFDTEQATVSYTDTGGLTSGYIGFEPSGTPEKEEIDWVHVRKYASPEPTWGTWGDEDKEIYNSEVGVGVGAQTELLGSRSEGDTGTGADATLSILATLLNAEIGSGIDAILALLSGRLESDTGSGVDSIIEQLLKLSDAGTGSDSSELLASLAASDVGVGDDVLITLIKAFEKFCTDAGVCLDELSELTATILSSEEPGYSGNDNLAGPGGVIVTHSLNLSNYQPEVIVAEESGAIGEIWITDIGANSFKVWNSGLSGAEFLWAIYKSGIESSHRGNVGLAGPGGTTITHNLNLAFYQIQLDVAEDSGAIGEIWITDIGNNSFKVRNSGSGLEGFSWVVYEIVAGVDVILELLAERLCSEIATGADLMWRVANVIQSMDTGSGVDTILELASVIFKSETGMGVDEWAQILAEVVKSDTGSGAELAELFLLGADTGSGVDAMLDIVNVILKSDAGSALDAILAQTVLGTDVGAGVDEWTERLAAVIQSETGAGADARLELLATILSSDIGVGKDMGRRLGAWILLKLLQEQIVDIEMTQEGKPVNISLSQEVIS